MLNTILNNLVMNAIKFTSIGGEINIYSNRMATDPESGKDFYKISVADTGIGMDNEFCSQLFTQNKPVSSPGTEKEQGTGLGLLLSREMVERHGGKIYAESTPGKGSVFSFLIPAFIQD
jgi:signal transduction histidine kinase